MMCKAEDRSLELAQDVEVGSLSRERGGCRGERGLAIEPGAADASAKQEVGNGFQDRSKFVAKFREYTDAKLAASAANARRFTIYRVTP